LEDKTFLDLFAGRAVSLEAASRGAQEVILWRKTKTLLRLSRKIFNMLFR